MELKFAFTVRAHKITFLLIVPYGIEIITSEMDCDI